MLPKVSLVIKIVLNYISFSFNFAVINVHNITMYFPSGKNFMIFIPLCLITFLLLRYTIEVIYMRPTA